MLWHIYTYFCIIIYFQEDFTGDLLLIYFHLLCMISFYCVKTFPKDETQEY